MVASKIIRSYWDQPASEPPVGTVANLENPAIHNNGPLALLVVCIIFTIAAAAGRMYSRIFVVKHLRVEDYLGLLALLSYVLVVYSYVRYWVHVGFFAHMWDLPVSALVETGRDEFLIVTGYCFVLLFAKTAILLEWVNILDPKATRTIFYWSARAIMYLNILLYAGGLITHFVACEPLESIWDWGIDHCSDKKARNTAVASINIVLNVLVLLLPQPVIWKLKMTTARKLGVFLVFFVGLLVVITSAGRLAATFALNYPTSIYAVSDTSYQFSTELEWYIAEVTCVMLVFCIPGLPKTISEHTVLLISRCNDAWEAGFQPKSSTHASDSTQNANTWNNGQERTIDEELSQAKNTHRTTIELAGMPDSHLKHDKEVAAKGVVAQNV